VTLALVAMAQKNMDLTVENLIAHREGKRIKRCYLFAGKKRNKNKERKEEGNENSIKKRDGTHQPQ
jgi:hypothetical protein